MCRRFAGVFALVFLAACTTGPKYVAPSPELPEQFDQVLSPVAAGQGATLLWSSFESAELDSLIERALIANNSIAEAAASLEETRSLSGLSIYSWFPTVTADGGVDRSKPSSSDPFIPPDQGTTEIWRSGFDASWEIDIFGVLRNSNASIQRRLEADFAVLQDVRLSIIAETAQAWFALIGARQQLALQQSQLAALEGRVTILQALLDSGRGTDLDLALGQSQARALAALLPQAEAEVVRHEQRLAVLTAWSTRSLRENVSSTVSFPTLPDMVQVGSPEDWLRRRPDVRAAERNLASATADIGIEVAEFYPRLNLLGSFGWTALNASSLGERNTERWSYGPSLSWSFLNFGRVKQRVRAADARADGAAARYRETVLLALEEMEGALANYRAAVGTQIELKAAVDASRRAFNLATLRFEAGRDDYLAVLDAERMLLDLQRQSLDADTRRATALASLYKALAGDFMMRAQ